MDGKSNLEGDFREQLRLASVTYMILTESEGKCVILVPEHGGIFDITY